MYTLVTPGAPRIVQIFVGRSTDHQPTMAQAQLLWKQLQAVMADSDEYWLLDNLLNGSIDYQDEYRIFKHLCAALTGDEGSDSRYAANKAASERGYPPTVMHVSFRQILYPLSMPGYSGGPAVMAYLLFRLAGRLPTPAQAADLWDECKTTIDDIATIEWAQNWKANVHFQCNIDRDDKARVGENQRDHCLNGLAKVLVGSRWADDNHGSTDSMIEFFKRLHEAVQARGIDCITPDPDCVTPDPELQSGPVIL